MASGQRRNKIRQYRKPLHVNLGMIIFGIIAIYVAICVVLYLKSSPIRGYEVTMGSLAVNNIYQGFAIRSEEVVPAEQSGYVNYYAREGEKVGVGNLVYAVDESGQLEEMLNQGELGENNLSEADLLELKGEIVNFANTYHSKNFSSTYDFKYNVQGTVLKLANINILESIDSLNASGMGDLINLKTAEKPGYVVYNVDGYEDTVLADVTTEYFDTSQYEKTQLIGNELISQGDPAYKIVDSDDWSLVIMLDEERAAEFENETYVAVKFLKNQKTSWAGISIYQKEDVYFAELTFNNSMVTFCTDRYIDVELIMNDEKGLKIPNSSIAELEFYLIPVEYATSSGSSDMGFLRETYDEEGNISSEYVDAEVYNMVDGEYYVDANAFQPGDTLLKTDSTDKYSVSKKGSLIGVYNINKGYADFKQIEILYQNNEYSIVKSNTDYGLNTYDYIVLDASSVNYDDFIYE